MGLRLREAREMVEDLSARELSRLAGLAESHVGLIESGKSGSPEVETIAKLAITLGASFAWLAGGDGTQPKPQRIRSAIAAARAAAGESAKSPAGA